MYIYFIVLYLFFNILYIYNIFFTKNDFNYKLNYTIKNEY
jgi:hypothetical protein